MPILIRTLIAFIVALGGAVFSALLARTHKQLCALISLGAGTLLGVTICAIGPECWNSLSPWQFLAGGASGYLLFAIISKYVFHVCPACAASHFDEAATHRFGEIAVAMMVALAIHCTIDGLALAAGSREPRVPAQPHWLEMSVTMAICVHKAPEGLALGALLLGAGYHRGRMLWLVAAVELTTVLGGVLGWFVFNNVSQLWVNLALANAGGGFIFLAAHAVLGEIMKHEKKIVLISFTLGFFLIAILILVFRLKAD
ncbi:MAG TPA: ZIP family metal transporter [Verrucomicrobiae bacterium]|jgi:zinc transporter ZupT